MDSGLQGTMNTCFEMLGVNEAVVKRFNSLIQKPARKSGRNDEFRPFRTLNCMYRNGKMSRERFELEWKLYQQEINMR